MDLSLHVLAMASIGSAVLILLFVQSPAYATAAFYRRFFVWCVQRRYAGRPELGKTRDLPELWGAMQDAPTFSFARVLSECSRWQSVNGHSKERRNTTGKKKCRDEAGYYNMSAPCAAQRFRISSIEDCTTKRASAAYGYQRNITI